MGATEVNGVSVPFLPVGGVDGLREKPFPASLPTESFAEILQKESSTLRFSHHAKERMEERGLTLDVSDRQKLHNAVEKAEAKGAREALVLLRNMAFIVSVKNRTVVTALDGERMSEAVVTNIDTAVIAESFKQRAT